MKVQGLAADEFTWPGLKVPSMIRTAGLADWHAVEAQWAESLGAIASEVVAGAAAVAPRDRRKTCTHCGLQPLCRIGTLAIEDQESERDE
jgi:hypothetical protein